MDPFAIVAGTDPPGSGNKNGTKRSLEILNSEVGTTSNDVANFMLANSEGEHSSGKTTNPLSGKHNSYPAGNACAPAHGSKIGGMGVAINTTAPPTTTRYEDTGSKQQKANKKAHLPNGARMSMKHLVYLLSYLLWLRFLC